MSHDRIKAARIRLARANELTALAGERMDAMRARFQGLANRHENGTAPVAVSSFNLFPTPPDLAARMVALASIEPGHRVLEPSAGTGRILDRIPECADLVAVELSPDLQAHLFRRYPRAKLKSGDFLARTAADLGGLFDRVVMNPPFQRGTDVRHILHARSMLAPGGLLVSLCYHGTAQAKHLQPIARTWDVLPAGSFASEGTAAGVVLMTLGAE